MFFSLLELFNILLTIVVVGIIFSRSLDSEEIKFWMKIAGISIILHELAHKFTALALGYYAGYDINIFGLLLGLALRFANFPFIFFIPGYVVIYGNPDPKSMAIIAAAGPLTNLALYIVSKELYKLKGSESFNLLANLNLWLFVLNILPIPPLDGFKVLYGLTH